MGDKPEEIDPQNSKSVDNNFCNNIESNEGELKVPSTPAYHGINTEKSETFGIREDTKSKSNNIDKTINDLNDKRNTVENGIKISGFRNTYSGVENLPTDENTVKTLETTDSKKSTPQQNELIKHVCIN